MKPEVILRNETNPSFLENGRGRTAIPVILWFNILVYLFACYIYLLIPVI
jgi:hypothetical protein